MLDNTQGTPLEEEFIHIIWKTIRNTLQYEAELFEMLNDLREDDIEDRFFVEDELRELDGYFDEIRKEIEEFFDEGFAPWGDEDDESICDILKEEGQISNYHIGLLEDILSTYYDGTNRIYNYFNRLNN